MGSVWNALEAERRSGVGRALHPDDLDHRAPGEERRHGRQQLVAAPQDADSYRAESRVTAEGQEVNTEIDHVNVQVRHRLAGVQDCQGADRASPIHNGSNGIDRA